MMIEDDDLKTDKDKYFECHDQLKSNIIDVYYCYC